jgi:hypothetical protein
MADYWTDLFSYVTGDVCSPELAYLALVGDELAAKRVPHTYFVTWNAGKWQGQPPKMWGVVSVCVCRHPLEQGLALGAGGEVLCVGSGDVHEEHVAAPDSSPRERGPLRAVRDIGGRTYAVGMNRQVYRRDGRNAWTSLDQGARPPREDRTIVGFEAVDGFAADDLYAVGWDGAIWHYNGAVWTAVDSPTNLILSSVCCGGDGKVYASGHRGLLLVGHGSHWKPIEHEGTFDDIWGLAWFQDKLYLSTRNALYTLEGEQLANVDMGDDPPETCFHVKATQSQLWSIGAKDVMAFDGTRWVRID